MGDLHASGEWFELPLPTAFGHGCLMSYQQCRHGATDSGCLKQLGFCCPQDHLHSAAVSTRLVRVGFEGLYSFSMQEISFRSIEDRSSKRR
jgi:hypothetical protein